MSKHLFGLIVTEYGTAANNRGETNGNITTLQKLLWKGEVHTTVSAEAIRWAIRWYWQNHSKILNRSFDDMEAVNKWADSGFVEWEKHLDDDVLGFMSAEAAKEEGNTAENTSSKKKKRGTCTKRRARLEITRAISLTPYSGDITFNAAGVGATPSASKTGKDPVPYGTEVHATRYQYGFAITPDELNSKNRVMDVLDAIVHLREVAGNHARFLYDFSPDSIVLRLTDDFCPRILYGFGIDREQTVTVEEIIRRIDAGDINAQELYVGGSIAMTKSGKELELRKANVFNGVKKAAEELKKKLTL